MKSFISIFVILFFILSFNECTYNKEDVLYSTKTNTCDTTNITFQAKVAPIFAQNCLICHGNAVSPPDGGGIRLQDYQDVKANIDRVYGAMSHKAGFIPMPLGSTSTIDPCQIKIVRIWKDAGAPNN